MTIYAGASILGGGTVIGRDSVIGSNVFITHSIPPCTTVSVKSQELQFKPRNCEGKLRLMHQAGTLLGRAEIT